MILGLKRIAFALSTSKISKMTLSLKTMVTQTYLLGCSVSVKVQKDDISKHTKPTHPKKKPSLMASDSESDPNSLPKN